MIIIQHTQGLQADIRLTMKLGVVSYCNTVSEVNNHMEKVLLVSAVDVVHFSLHSQLCYQRLARKWRWQSCQIFW